ncbi:TerC family protein [Ureibacillus terrenus]|uniref:TerC family protein n=1 Tax=Ureibacillus terrenus TaxID=118246 RepID=A0A540V3J5_9BACL|nr:TerC family protein [Ureibacillus terrenus]MED3763176.1 TerC family protein [Ureibacillus terrenus]TQE91320.1 TerC family protein [Ureibacillus terrenus]
MEAIILEYLWVLVVLVMLEGLLAADNAVVMAVMVKHLPQDQQRKALFYGLFGAFIFRFVALFLITVLVNYWEIQAIGAAYLLFIAVKNIYEKKFKKEEQEKAIDQHLQKGKGLWATVLKVEFADIAFAVDSMLAAVAIAVTLPKVGDFHIGGINAGQFTVMFLGGIIGMVLMRFAAQWFVKLLNNYPELETAAFLIVGWVGIKLVVLTLSHQKVGVLPHDFPHSAPWEITFWVVLVSIALGGWITSVAKKKKHKKEGAKSGEGQL